MTVLQCAWYSNTLCLGKHYAVGGTAYTVIQPCAVYGTELHCVVQHYAECRPDLLLVMQTCAVCRTATRCVWYSITIYGGQYCIVCGAALQCVGGTSHCVSESLTQRVWHVALCVGQLYTVRVTEYILPTLL